MLGQHKALASSPLLQLFDVGPDQAMSQQPPVKPHASSMRALGSCFEHQLNLPDRWMR
jgi:hypothetical protein